MAVEHNGLETCSCPTPARRRREGQVRIVEITIAISMVISVILLVMFFSRPMRSPYLRETVDLRRLAHNLLSQLADAGAFEQIIAEALNGDVTWEGRMRLLVSASLPAGIFFRMEIYQVTRTRDGSIVFERLDKGRITNAALGTEMTESEAIYFTYVCTHDPDRMRGRILYIIMVIGYAG